MRTRGKSKLKEAIATRSPPPDLARGLRRPTRLSRRCRRRSRRFVAGGESAGGAESPKAQRPMLLGAPPDCQSRSVFLLPRARSPLHRNPFLHCDDVDAPASSRWEGGPPVVGSGESLRRGGDAVECTAAAAVPRSPAPRGSTAPLRRRRRRSRCLAVEGGPVGAAVPSRRRRKLKYRVD